MLLNYIQPSVEVFNVRIDEPVTTLTNLLLAFICFYASFGIRHQENSGRLRTLFTFHFLALGLGSFFGGLLGHAFLYALSPYWKLVSWILILVSVAILVFALAELARPLMKPIYLYLVAVINLVALATAIYHISRTLAFSAVKYYCVFGLILLAGSLGYIVFRKTGNRGVIMLLAGLATGIISMVIFSFTWGLSPWFNHNDISHLLLCFSVLILLKGALLILRTHGNLV